MKQKGNRPIDIEIDSFPVRKPSKRHLDFVIDKLTNSIENRITGEAFATRIMQLHPEDASLLKATRWGFDWTIELKAPGHEVYTLTTLDNPDVFHGLISISDKQDHIFMDLIESAPFNVGSNKLYVGVAGNLVAYACYRSFKSGYNGVIAFDAKTRLIQHYEESLFAKRFTRNRMFIPTAGAEILVQHYLKNFDEDRLQETR